MTHSNFIEIFDDTYQNCIQCQCPVDRVFRNCGVRNSEVLLYIYIRTDPITLPCSLARAGNDLVYISRSGAIPCEAMISSMSDDGYPFQAYVSGHQ